MKFTSKYLFYGAVLCWMAFEILHVYFIMPLPGSQELNSVDAAYFLHYFRWSFRILLTALIFLNLKIAFTASKWFTIMSLSALLYIIYLSNLKMSADEMFKQPQYLEFQNADHNKVDPERLILGITYKNESKAYPIQYLGYHHQVRDTISGKPIIVTYCTVCRTGRVFEPLVNGKLELFRLVGMDHFNALFEDHTTKSWWRQVNGESVAGQMKGHFLPEFPSSQMTLQKWLTFYPNSLVMQADKLYKVEYDSMSNYEHGKYYGKLTKRDSHSWKEKSWVVGIKLGKHSRAYDWNTLVKQNMIYDTFVNQPVVILIASDKKSFSALQLETCEQIPIWKNDTLLYNNHNFDLLGNSLQPGVKNLKIIQSYQEYWHSWKFLNPETIINNR